MVDIKTDEVDQNTIEGELRAVIINALGNVLNYPVECRAVGKDFSVLANKTIEAVLGVLEGNDIDVSQYSSWYLIRQWQFWADKLYGLPFGQLSSAQQNLIKRVIQTNEEESEKA